jgi:hypothetical protein
MFRETSFRFSKMCHSLIPPDVAARRLTVTKLLFASLVALAPIAAFAGGDLPAASGAVDQHVAPFPALTGSDVPVVGVVDPATILSRRPVDLVNPGGKVGVGVGGVSGNIPSGLQTRAFSVVGPAGPYPKGPALAGACSRPSGTSPDCRRDVPLPE